MADPKAAFTANPPLQWTLDLDLHRVAPTVAASRSGRRATRRVEVDPEKLFARGHTEQHMAVTGAVRVGEETFDLEDGLGMRDHSWGPRFWQSIWWYRWLTVNLGPDLGFAVTIARRRGRRTVRHAKGFIYDADRYGDDRLVDVDDATSPPTTTTSGSRSAPATITTDDHVYEIDGEVWSAIPLRNRRDGLVTRIAEGMTRGRARAGSAVGLTEHLDQVVDGRPVGTLVGS